MLSLEQQISKAEAELTRIGNHATAQGTATWSGISIDLRDATEPELVPVYDGRVITDGGNTPRSEPTTQLNPAKDGPSPTTILSSNIMQSLVSSSMPSVSGATDLLMRIRLGMTPSLSQAGHRGIGLTATSRIDDNELNASVIASMPPRIVHALIRKYVATMRPHHPFLDGEAINRHLGYVKLTLNAQLQDEHSSSGTRSGETQLLVAPSYHFLIIYLVLAIAVTIGINDAAHASRYMSLSISLFVEGIGHFSSLSTCPSEITWLQAMLLTTLYATIVPRSANVWVLSGMVMRTCIELGLHRELPVGIDLHEETGSRETRRMLFWSAYCVDRSICSSLQRPLTTLDATISTRMPGEDVDEAFTSSISYYQLLSEMMQVHFQSEPLPSGLEWDDWLADMERRLREWHSEHPRDVRVIDPTDHALSRLSRGLLMLHRPSPRKPMPSQESLVIAFEAACTAAQANREQLVAGSLRRPWVSAHHTLEAAMVVLYCLRHGYSSVRAQFTSSQVLEMTKVLTANFLTIAEQGWPEVSTYAGIYERLLGTLIEPIFSPSTTHCFSAAQEAELMRLLYPDAAQLEKLRGGHHLEQHSGSWDPELDLWTAPAQLPDSDSLLDVLRSDGLAAGSSVWNLPDFTELESIEDTFHGYDLHGNF